MTDRSSIALRIKGSRATLLGVGDSLENIDTTTLDDGALCYVIGEHLHYELHRDDVTPPAPPAIVAPITGPGRWVPATGGATGPQGQQGFQGAQGNQGFQGTGSQGAQGTTGAQGPGGGAQGAQGATGVQGFQGATGATGSQGAQGFQGTQGQQGFQGRQGATGAQGAQGFQGSQGFQGATGQQGFQGAQGFQGGGFQGAQGALGAQGSGGGAQGAQGATGVQGFQGAQGFQGGGFQGATGNQGFQGGLGAQGSAGPQGATGNQGATGTTGAQGGQGFQGATGTTGTTGAQGGQGFQGAQGRQGATGTSGAQGFQGATGATGATGNQGATGAQGAQGFQGATGTQGFQGAQGRQGSTGAQGATGAQGSQGSQGFQGASAASQLPLSDVYVVDGGTTAAVSNGSAAAPFKTVTLAVAAAVTAGLATLTLLITPGDYSAEALVTISAISTVSFMGYGSPDSGVARVILASFQFNAATDFFAQDLSINTLTDNTTRTTFTLVDTTVSTINGNTNTNVFARGISASGVTGTIGVFSSCNVVALDGIAVTNAISVSSGVSITLTNCVVTVLNLDVIGGSLLMRDTDFTGNIIGFSNPIAILKDCSFGPSSTFQSFTDLRIQMDDVSRVNFEVAGGNINSIKVTGLDQAFHDIGTVAVSTAINFNSNGVNQSVTLGAATLQLSPVVGIIGEYTLEVHQDATGGRLATWSVTPIWIGGITPVFQTAASAVDIIKFFYDGTHLYAWQTALALPRIVADIYLKAQTAGIGATAAVAVAQKGLYRVALCDAITTAGTSGTLTLSVVSQGDGGSTQTQSLAAIQVPTLGDLQQGSFIVEVAAASAINYQVVAGSFSAGSLQYSVRVTVEQLSMLT